eukprot:6958088-Prymnesium_polylepis.1
MGFSRSMSTFGIGDEFVSRSKSSFSFASALVASGRLWPAPEGEGCCGAKLANEGIVTLGIGERSLPMSVTSKIARERSGSAAAGSSRDI